MVIKDEPLHLESIEEHTELHRRSAELALLNRIITATTSIQDPVELLVIVCQELATIFGAPQAAAALLDEQQTSLTVIAEYLSQDRPSSRGQVIPVTGNIATQYVLEHRAPLPISDVLNDQRMAPVRHEMERRGTVSMLILPLLARDEVIGTIGIDLIERHEFSADEIRLASSLAKSTAQSLAMARMFEKMQLTLNDLQELTARQQQAEIEQARLNKDLSLINRVITATTSAQDPIELLTIVCRELALVFGAPQAAAALLNEEQTSLTVAAEYRTEDRPTSLGRTIPVAGNLATQHVLKHRAPLPISDVLTDPRNAAMHQQMEGRGTVSMLILPLLARDEIIGTIGLNYTERHEFTEDEIRLAFNLAMSTAQSLATARMFDQIQVTLAELQRVEEARRQQRDDLDRYLPDAIREEIETSFYAKVNQQAELDQVVRSRQFIEDPLNHVALFSDHGVVHVRDVARNLLSILDTINGELIPHRNRLWLEFMKGYGAMLAYNHDIGMMDFSAFGRAMHPEFAAQAVFTSAYDSIVDTFWDENWGNVSWRLIKLAEHGALTGDLKRVLRELLSMSIGHSKSKVSIKTLNDRTALRRTMLESISTDIGHLYHLQQIRKAEKKLAKNQVKTAGPGNPDLLASLEMARQEYQEYMQRGIPLRTPIVDQFYANYEDEAYTWLESDHPSLQALTRDVVDTLRALRVADALRQRGTTLKTSGGYQIFVDQNTANAVIALQKSSGEMILFEVDKTHSIGEANIASSELDLGGNLRLSFNRGFFRTEAATRHAAYCCAMIIDDIQRDVLESFWRPDQPSTQRKYSDDIQILIEETDDNIHFAESVLEELASINPELVQRSRIVPSLKNISDEDRQRYLTAAELNWTIEHRREVISQVARSGHKTQRIDPEIAFTDVRLIELRQGDVLIKAGAPPGFVYIPMGDGLQSLPLGGYQRHDVQPWIPLGNTSVIRGDVQEARVTAEKNIRLLIIPKEIYLKYWHDTYNLAEFAPVIDRLFAQDEQRRNEQALNILKQFIMLDGRLEEHQVAFVQRFIETFGEAADLERIRAEMVEPEPIDFASLRQNAVSYLASSPPYMQVARLRDLINLLVETGEAASEGKRLVLGELNGLLAEYLDQDKVSGSYQVVVVPQSTEQETAIRTLLPAASRIETGFGVAYLCGTYHSSDYAEMIRNRYRSLRMFALVVHGDGNELQAEELVEDIQFSPEELEMYAAFINRLTPPEFIKLVRTGRWERAEVGDILIAEGEAVDHILFISKGEAEAASKGNKLQGIDAGSFIGEMEFLAGGPAFATVTAASPMHYIAWERDDLENLLAINPEMGTAMQALFSTDVVKKLHTSSQRMVHNHSRTDPSSPTTG